MNILPKSLSGLMLAFSLLSGTYAAHAIPAIPEPIKITQPDGSVITICIHGDEKGFTIMTPDNLPIVQNAAGIYEYANPWDTSKGSGMRVSDIELRTAAEKTWISTSGIVSAPAHMIKVAHPLSPSQPLLRKSPNGPAKVKITNYPTIGRHKALVVLVEFADKQFTTMDNAWDYYNGMLNEPGFTYKNGADGSARDFYLDSSAGLYDPDFVVVGPVQLPGTVDYYGADTTTELDPNAWQMIVDACNAIDEEVDYSEFDADGDGVVDSIYFFYAGFGEADSGTSTAIWPHSGLLKDNWGVDLELDGMVINNYACSNEIRFNSSPLYVPVGIGTFVHEFGHVLGIADHYDTRYQSGRSGVEQWDTMAAASYNNNQNTPPAFSAFERAELGWMELTEVTPTEEGVLRIPVLTADDPQALVVRVPDETVDEYFILERRNKTGWDSTLPAEGLLVWHVDMAEDLWWNNEVNIDPVHQHLDIVEADGTENTTSFTSDVFPGRGKVTKFDFKAWSGDTLFSFDHVAELPEETLVIFGGTQFMPATPELTISDIYGTSFNVELISNPNILEYELSVYDAEDNVLEGFSSLKFDEPTTVEVTGLSPQSEYKVEVIGIAGSYRSEAGVKTVATNALEFFEKSPENLSVTHLGYGVFEATWDALEGATDYEVTLLRKAFSDPVTYTYGFDDDLVGMPEGWSTNTTKLSRPVFGEKTPAMRLDAEGDWLEISYPGSDILSLNFYQFSQISSNNLYVEGFDGNGEVIFEQTLAASSEGTVSSIEFPDYIEKVRISFCKSGGYMVIDDIDVTVRTLEDTPCAPYISMSSAGETSFIMEGLEEDVEYGVAVVAKNASTVSRRSEVFRFIPSEAMSGVGSVISPEDAAEEWFDLSGRKVTVGNLPAGLYIVRKGTESRKVMGK